MYEMNRRPKRPSHKDPWPSRREPPCPPPRREPSCRLPCWDEQPAPRCELPRCEPRCEPPRPPRREPPCPPRCEIKCAPRCEPPCPPPRCEPPCPPPCFDPCENPRYLTPRVICSGRYAQRCMPECISVSGLPLGISEPLCLVGLEAGCEEPSVCIKESCRGSSPAVAEVTVPLKAWVRDACGRTYCGFSQMTVFVRMPASCLRERGTVLADAEVRLVDAGRPACRATFDIRVEVCVKVAVIRMESRGCERDCGFMNNLPYYPQPWF